MQSLKSKTLDKIKELEISPKRSLGQNFLVNEAVIEKIIKCLSKEKPNTIEVGPGLGALTEHLRDLPEFRVIELDRKFSEYWRQQNVEVIEADALKVNWAELCQNKNTQLISNLPYQISSSLVIELSMGPDLLDHMVLMFQKEVAQRIVVEPGGGDYGLLSVIAQTFWNINLVLEAGTNDFYPRPKIVSRVLQFKRRGFKDHGLENQQRQKFLKFVKAAFQQRRKFLLKNISTYLAGEKKQLIVEILKGWGFDEKVRAEKLSPENFLELFKQVGVE